MKLSKSRLTTFITCPLKFYIYYVLMIKPLKTSPELIIGSTVHHLISIHYIKKMTNEPCDLNAELEEYWAKYDLENSDFADQAEMDTAKHKSLEFAEFFIDETNIDPLYTEYSFSLPMINVNTGETLPDLELVGIIDLIDQPNGNGKIRALEIKTKAKKPNDFTARTSLELTCYAYWLKFLHDQEVVPVGYVNIIKTKKPYIHWQDDERCEKDFVDLYHTMENVYKNIMDERFYRNPGVHCNWCDFKPVCANDTPAIETVFGHEALDTLRQARLS